MASITTPRTSNNPRGPAQSHPYTCNTCQVAFRNGDLQRTHMRTDWHRYNLKRRVASLPPISAEVFAEKVLTAQASSTAVAAKASFEKPCSACQKIYYSQNAYENHLRSQKHRLRVSILAKDGVVTEDSETGSITSSTISLGEPINGAHVLATVTAHHPTVSIDPEAEAEFSKVIDGIKETKISNESVSRRPKRPHHSGGESRTEHPLSPEKTRRDTEMPQADSTATDDEKSQTCLFCNFTSSNGQGNVEHMSRIHGLFIPERTYLTDLAGLLGWLWQRIHETPHECIYCHKIKISADAVQGHMRDLGHCKIAFEDEVDMIEVGQFYDFSSTYSDDELDEQIDEDMKKEDGWEDDSDIDSEDADDVVKIDSVPDLRRRRPSSGTQPENQGIVIDEELYLASGKVVGHRSLAKYYRQNLHNYPSRAERLEQQRTLEAARDEGSEDLQMTDGDSGRGRQLISRANGGLGMIGVPDAKKREVQAVEKRDTKRALRAEKQYQWGVNKRGNMQKHFRDPLLQ